MHTIDSIFLSGGYFPIFYGEGVNLCSVKDDDYLLITYNSAMWYSACLLGTLSTNCSI